MAQRDEYIKKVRKEFVRLCVAFAPPHLKPNREKEAPKEFEAVFASGKFLKIAVHEDCLLAKTRTVRPKKAGKTYQLGEYMIEIGSKHFAAFNLTRQLNQFHGPHINASGTFCMTEGREEIMTYIAEGRLNLALHMIEHALWLVDTGFPYGGVNIENWPLEEEGENQ